MSSAHAHPGSAHPGSSHPGSSHPDSALNNKHYINVIFKKAQGIQNNETKKEMIEAFKHINDTKNEDLITIIREKCKESTNEDLTDIITNILPLQEDASYFIPNNLSCPYKGSCKRKNLLHQSIHRGIHPVTFVQLVIEKYIADQTSERSFKRQKLTTGGKRIKKITKKRKHRRRKNRMTRK
jgi:hypothetical protein